MCLEPENRLVIFSLHWWPSRQVSLLGNKNESLWVQRMWRTKNRNDTVSKYHKCPRNVLDSLTWAPPTLTGVQFESKVTWIKRKCHSSIQVPSSFHSLFPLTISSSICPFIHLFMYLSITFPDIYKQRQSFSFDSITWSLINIQELVLITESLAYSLGLLLPSSSNLN